MQIETIIVNSWNTILKNFFQISKLLNNNEKVTTSQSLIYLKITEWFPSFQNSRLQTMTLARKKITCCQKKLQNDNSLKIKFNLKTLVYTKYHKEQNVWELLWVHFQQS